MSTDTTEAGTGAVIAKIVTVWSAIGSSIVLPTVAQWEAGLRILGLVLGIVYTVYMIRDLRDKRARRQQGLEADTERGQP